VCVAGAGAGTRPARQGEAASQQTPGEYIAFALPNR
jgi:hypothetical protein